MDEQEYQARVDKLRKRAIVLQWEFAGLMIAVSDVPNSPSLVGHAEGILNTLEDAINTFNQRWPQ